MITAMREWILRLTCAALVSAAAMAITPNGNVKKVVQLVCGLLTVTALLSVAVDFDYSSFSKYAAEYRTAADEITEDAEKDSDNLCRSVIEDKCATYILDKGCEIGITEISAEVSTKWSDDGYWYPTEAAIVSNASESEKEELMSSIEAELGITEDNQIWSTGNENG